MASMTMTTTTTGGTAPATSCHASCRTSTCPPWLQAALADIEQRVQSLAASLPQDAESDSFAERAENYYQKRPLLIALLQDLHHRYLYLADRYSLSLVAKQPNPHHRRRSSSLPSDLDLDDDDSASDADSSLSFQTPHLPLLLPPDPPQTKSISADLDLVVAELVSTLVERDLMAADASEAGRRLAESARKIELQGSLVEVLESERMVLLGENARLAFRAASAEEEGRAAAAELGYMRRRAAELARAVVKLREDHRVCMLGRKVEGLQSQIFALERRNRECMEAMARREKEKVEARAELDRLREENRRLREGAAEAAARSRGLVWWSRRWWGRGRKHEWSPFFSCAPHVNKDGDNGYKGCF